MWTSFCTSAGGVTCPELCKCMWLRFLIYEMMDAFQSNFFKKKSRAHVNLLNCCEHMWPKARDLLLVWIFLVLVVIVAREMVIDSHMDVLLGIFDYSRESTVFSLNDSLCLDKTQTVLPDRFFLKIKKIEKRWLRHTCRWYWQPWFGVQIIMSDIILSEL